jgi:hypothetical protein
MGRVCMSAGFCHTLVLFDCGAFQVEDYELPRSMAVVQLLAHADVSTCSLAVF